MAKAALHLKDIPKEYREKCKLLGKGQTSIALLTDTNVVLVFTRDKMKVKWLTSKLGLKLGVKLMSFSGKPTKIEGLDKFPIYLIKMPRFYPLNSKNKSIVIKEAKRFWKVHDFFYKKGSVNMAKGILDFYKKHYPESLLMPLLKFSTRYSEFYYDFSVKNCVQDKKGNIVILDPIVSSALINTLLGRSFKSPLNNSFLR